MRGRQVHAVDYQRSITVNVPAAVAHERVNRVSEWWTESFKGRSQAPGDTFTVRFGATFVDFRVAEVLPTKRAVWQVTDCHLHWLNDKKEWNGTRLGWEISSDGGETTRLRMTHVGLVPGIECYGSCEIGWDFYVGESLLKLLTDGKGLPDRGVRA